MKGALLDGQLVGGKRVLGPVAAGPPVDDHQDVILAPMAMAATTG